MLSTAAWIDDAYKSYLESDCGREVDTIASNEYACCSTAGEYGGGRADV